MRFIRVLAAVAAATLAAGLMPALPAAAFTSPQWHQTFSAANAQVTGKATAVSPDGGTVFVTGEAFTPGNTGFGETIAYNAATGAVIWSARFNHDPGIDENGLSSIAVSATGSTVFVSGYSGDATGPVGLVQAVVAYNAATGAQLWQVIGTVHGGAAVSPVVVSSNGATVFVTGVQTSAYDAATGALLWREPVGGDAIALSATGAALYVTLGGSTAALNATTGTTIWQATESGNRVHTTVAALSPDGSVLFVAGNRYTGTKGISFAVAYSASSGAPLWTKITGGTGSGMIGLGATRSGSAVIVSDYTLTMPDTIRWVTLALNPATGAILWEKAKYWAVDGPFASAFALSPDGSTAYVTGFNRAWVTIGYNTANGTQVFRAGYDGRLENIANAIAISPNGSQVVVTGLSNDMPTSGDVMATAAYSTG